MDSSNNNVVEATQGVDSLPVPAVDTIKTWMVKDLGACITFLQALINDPNLQNVMAVYLQGRISNAKHKPDPSQVPLFQNDKLPKQG